MQIIKSGKEGTAGKTDDREEMIEKAKSFMEEHYKEALSLESISGIIGISPCYFSHIFKNETGKKLCGISE